MPGLALSNSGEAPLGIMLSLSLPLSLYLSISISISLALSRSILAANIKWIFREDHDGGMVVVAGGE